MRLKLASSPAALAAGLSAYRGVIGVMILIIHGWHKLHGGIAHLRTGAPWPLLEEVAAMGVPAPQINAWVATLVQLVGGAMLAAGLCTRATALALTCVLAGAVAQNLQAHRDPQLAVLYTLAVALFIWVGGTRYSWDGRSSQALEAPHGGR